MASVFSVQSMLRAPRSIRRRTLQEAISIFCTHCNCLFSNFSIYNKMYVCVYIKFYYFHAIHSRRIYFWLHSLHCEAVCVCVCVYARFLIGLVPKAKRSNLLVYQVFATYLRGKILCSKKKILLHQFCQYFPFDFFFFGVVVFLFFCCSFF